MKMDYNIIRDTREKTEGWYFNNEDSKWFRGTVIKGLKTGDYSIEGLEDKFVIERKHSTGELANNVTEKRMVDVLNRLESIPNSFIICEFTLDDILRFPYNSGIPERYWPKIRIKPAFLLKCITDWMLKTKIVFAGNRGREISISLFKRIISNDCQE